MRKFGIVWERKRRRPCGPIGQDGSPRWRPMPWTGTSGAALPSRPSPPTSPASHAWTRASSACPESRTARQMCCLPANAPSRWRRGSCWTHMTSSESSSFPTTSGHARIGAPTMPHGPAGTGPGSPESGSPCPGGPAAGTMHASGASGDGWRSRWETRRISLRGGHGACRQARRLLQRSQGAGASRMADPHGACRKVHCLAVCGDWGPPQNASGRISALVDMPIIPLGGIPCGREPASVTLFIQRFPNRFPPCGQAREIWKRMSAKLRRLHGLDLLFEPAI